MKYQVDLFVSAPREKVFSAYLDHDAMKEWETGLTKIESIQGSLFDEGSIGYLHFIFGEHQMKMKVTNEKIECPDHIIQIYEVPGAWNRCDNHFIDLKDKTHWIMDVEFRFDEDPNLPIERFMDKTKAGMAIFKAYIEGKTHV
ncbi:MAG: SRPBCC family protein [Acholeplasma sp.]|nr:MAG: SRPBCC family protein [Acholeplasma sp.]